MSLAPTSTDFYPLHYLLGIDIARGLWIAFIMRFCADISHQRSVASTTDTCRPTRHSHNSAVDLLYTPTIGYARVYLGANLQTIGFVAQLRLKWVTGPRFSPLALPIRVQCTPPRPPNPVVCFPIQVQVRNLGVGLRFCMQL